MAIDVTVSTQCDRCKRKETVTISSDKLEEFELRHSEEEAQQQAVNDFVAEHKDALPDLVVILKGEVTMFNNVCDAHCVKPIRNHLDLIFKEREPRKPRKKKAKDGNTGPAEPEEKTDTMTKAKAKVKAKK